MIIPIDEVVHFDVITSNASTGAASDADSTPTFDVFEENTDTPILDDQSMTKRTSLTGNYRGSFAASAANGFEAGKWYSVVVSATVSSVAGKAVAMNFRVAPAEGAAGVPKVDVSHFNGAAGTFASGRPEVNTSHLGGTAYTSGAIPSAAAGSSGGLLISGSNAGTTTLAALTVTGTCTISDGLLVNRSSGNSAAVVFTGNGSGAGFRAIGGATGRGMDIVGGTDVVAFQITATGTGNAMALTPGATGAGLFINGGGTSGNALVCSTTDGHAINLAAGGSSKHGLQATGGTGGTSDGIKCVAGTGGVGFRADTFTVTAALTAGTNAVPWNASWDAEVQSEVQDAVEANHLDHLIAVADPGGVVANSSFLAKLTSKSATPAFSSYDNTTDSLEAIRDNGDAAWVTNTAASIRSAVGLASANLDTQLTAIDDFLDTEVAAIKAKTDSLTFTAAGKVDAKLTSDGLDLVVIETSLNARQAVSLIAAACCGVTSGMGTTTATLKGAGVATTRISATIDASDNRTAITLTPPS